LTRLDFRLEARQKRSFNTVLDANRLLDPSDSRTSEIHLRKSGDKLLVETLHPIRGGAIAETYAANVTSRGLRSESLVRRLLEGEREVRKEEVDFTSKLLELPESTYPEVLMPFLLNSF